MEDTDRDPENEAGQIPVQARPAWVDEAGYGVKDPGRPPARSIRRDRAPVPGSHEYDGLYVHVGETAGLIATVTWLAAALVPHSIHLWMITVLYALITMVTCVTARSLSGSASLTAYLAVWGVTLTAWITGARLTSPFHPTVVFMLLAAFVVLAPVGVAVIRKHRDKVKRVTEIGLDTVNVRQIRHWDDLLHTLGVQGVKVRNVLRVEGGYQVHCRLGKFTAGGPRPTTIESIRELAGPIGQHKRLLKGSVYIQEEPDGHTSADFIIHVRTDTGPRLARYLPAANDVQSINKDFGLGVLDTGREFRLRLREVVTFICGVRGSGKSTMLNVFIAQLCRMPDCLIFMIDLKGGQEARAWLMPFLDGRTDRPVIDWLATTREEASIMLDAIQAAGVARAESGRYGRKLRPSRAAPAIIVICDETTVMTGHQIREDNLSNTKLAIKLLQIAETFRSVAIDPVIATVRAVVDNTGNSGLKAQSEYKIGMKVGTIAEGQAIFGDDYQAAKQLAALRDKGMFIPKLGAELFPPVHGYNITDGEPDDDGHPTEDRITPIVLATTARRPAPEQLIRDAMGEPYARRWKTDHMKVLTDGWLAEAENRPPAGEAAPVEDFETMMAREFGQGGLGSGPAPAGPDDDEDDTGQGLHRAHKRMRELLIGQGRLGWKADDLWHKLLEEGFSCARGTMHNWLARDEKLGYVFRTGKPRSRWVWRLKEGAEFDIPGMED